MVLILKPNKFYDVKIKPKLDLYISFIFEDLCKEYLIRRNLNNEDNPFFEMSRFWGNHQTLKREIELNIVTKDQEGITVYECKWTSDPFRKK